MSSGSNDPRFGWRWALVHSRLLDESVVFVTSREHADAAKAKHPGLAVYYWPELEELVTMKDAPEFPRLLAAVHAAKLEFDGVVLRVGVTAGADPVLVPGREDDRPASAAPATKVTVYRSTRPRIRPIVTTG